MRLYREQEIKLFTSTDTKDLTTAHIPLPSNMLFPTYTEDFIVGFFHHACSFQQIIIPPPLLWVGLGRLYT